MRIRLDVALQRDGRDRNPISMSRVSPLTCDKNQLITGQFDAQMDSMTDGWEEQDS